MSGGASGPDDRWTEAQLWGWAELLGTFGAVSSAALEAELAQGPPWQPVSAGEVGGLLGAYRQARAEADMLRAALVDVGLSAAEFPGLSGGVDGEGRAVVRLGDVSAVTGTRLVRVLRARPNPPAERGKAA